MSLDDIVSVTITTQTTAPTRVGFGVPLVMSYHTVFAERVRSYTSVAAMIADGFTASDAAVRAATALFAQSPRPSRVLIGRELNTAKKKINLIPATPLQASTDYVVYVNGKEAKFTTDATPTVAEITAGLKAAIDALGENVTTTDNTTDLDIEANTVADWFALQVATRRQFTREDTTPDAGGASGIVQDITDVQEENDDWYTLHLTNHSKAVISAAAAYVETLVKLMVVSSADDEIYDNAVSDDVASTLQTANYARTALLYHPRPHQFAGAAWAGIALPKDPGSITWKFKTLAGVDTPQLSDTEVSVIEGKDCNHYTEVAGVSITQQGITSAAEFIDITRGTDFIRARLQEFIYTRLVNSDKIPYTDRGVAVVEAEVRAVLSLAINNEILAADPAPEVEVPLVSSVPFADRAARLLPDVEFSGTLAGAIHELEVSGVVSV